MCRHPVFCLASRLNVGMQGAGGRSLYGADDKVPSSEQGKQRPALPKLRQVTRMPAEGDYATSRVMTRIAEAE